MRLGLSWVSSNDNFSEALMRVRREMDPIFDSFASIEAVSPTCDAILLGLADDEPETLFRKIHNKQGFFQVFAGCPATTDVALLKRAVFDRLLKTVRACPLHPKDRAAFEALFEDWEREHLS